MVRFSSSLEDRQPQNRKKTASQSNENVDYSNYQKMQPQKIIPSLDRKTSCRERV